MKQSNLSADDDAPTREFVRPARGFSYRTPDTSGDGLWDASDVARYLKVSRFWVYHRAEAGLLPCIRVGGLLRFDPECGSRLHSGRRGV